jgi:hypothetical protein
MSLRKSAKSDCLFFGCDDFPSCKMILFADYRGRPSETNGMPPLKKWDGKELPRRAVEFAACRERLLRRIDRLKARIDPAEASRLEFLAVTTCSTFADLGRWQARISQMGEETAQAVVQRAVDAALTTHYTAEP